MTALHCAAEMTREQIEGLARKAKLPPYMRDTDAAIEALGRLLSLAAELEGVGWVPVTERLPEAGLVVLVWARAERYLVDDNGESYSQDCSTADLGQRYDPAQVYVDLAGAQPYVDGFASPYGDAYEITHWMPLPTPPKQQGDK